MRVLPISDKVADYAGKFSPAFRNRASARRYRPSRREDRRQDPRRTLEKIPAMLVVGAKEAENQAFSYRDRIAGDLGAMPLEDALARLAAECTSRQSQQTASAPVAVTTDERAEDHTYSGVLESLGGFSG